MSTSPNARKGVTRFTLDLDSDLHKGARIAAIEDGEHLSDIMRGLLDGWLRKREAARIRATPAPAPVPMPVPAPVQCPPAPVGLPTAPPAPLGFAPAAPEPRTAVFDPSEWD